MTLTQRFQIEDILAQDHHGVVFAAVDAETGRHVALRRFFPFGSDGGGLQPEERAAYDIGVKRLAEVVHPALRAVVTGGCDPVDGMPFLVTEWVEGSSLSKLLQQGFLTVESAIVLMDQALEVSELLSQVLADDEVWVETAPSAIVIGGGESDRGITFWISPFRWLSTEETRPGLMPLVELLDEVMGWKAGSVSDDAGGGLGSWRNWLAANAQKATLAAARAALVTATKGGQVASSAPAVARKVPPAKSAVAHRPIIVAKPQSSWVGKAVIAVLVLTALGLGGVLYYRNQKEKSPAASSAVLEETPANQPKASKSALDQVDLSTKKEKDERETNTRQAIGDPTPGTVKPAVATPPAVAEKTSRKEAAKVFGPEDGDELIKLVGTTVTLEGTVQEVRLSESKKTLFLNLKLPYDKKWARGEFATSPENAEKDRKWMDPWLGKKVRITGEATYRLSNPTVIYTKPGDVEVLSK